MASYRQCFYCKQSFQSAQFNRHLRQCPHRQKTGPMKNNSAPHQPMSAFSLLWSCPLCSFQNSQNAAVCTMCQRGKRPNKQDNPNKPNGDWECSICTFINNKMNRSCQMCNNPNPNAKSAVVTF